LKHGVKHVAVQQSYHSIEICVQGLLYCDLKPSNLLLDENGCIKLGGFGLSRKVSALAKSGGGHQVRAAQRDRVFQSPCSSLLTVFIVWLLRQGLRALCNNA
jgi:serine/threonine protein kinase